MPALRQMYANARARSGSCDDRVDGRRLPLLISRFAAHVGRRIKRTFDAIRRSHPNTRRRYLSLPAHDDSGARFLETALLRTGLVLVAVYLLIRVDADANAERDLSAFAIAEPDTSLWSPGRIAQYRDTASSSDALVGALFIRSLNLSAPIYDDTSQTHLNRGVGLIAATAKPGDAGNVGVAGHRDGYFRVLENIERGDTIELVTREHSYSYRVLRVAIVERDDASALRPTPTPTVTLVTCYPFYFVGPAPQRFVVQAELVSRQPRPAFASNRGID
jgi:sortase A